MKRLADGDRFAKSRLDTHQSKTDKFTRGWGWRASPSSSKSRSWDGPPRWYISAAPWDPQPGLPSPNTWERRKKRRQNAKCLTIGRRYQQEGKCWGCLFRWGCSCQYAWWWRSGLSSARSFSTHPRSSGLQWDKSPTLPCKGDDLDNEETKPVVLFKVAKVCVWPWCTAEELSLFYPLKTLADYMGTLWKM